MDVKVSLRWCEKHRSLFEDNDVCVGAVTKEIISSVAASIARRRGHSEPDDLESAAAAVNYYGKGRPFCCRIGDEKLQAILIKNTAEVERKKANEHL